MNDNSHNKAETRKRVLDETFDENESTDTASITEQGESGSREAHILEGIVFMGGRTPQGAGTEQTIPKDSSSAVRPSEGACVPVIAGAEQTGEADGTKRDCPGAKRPASVPMASVSQDSPGQDRLKIERPASGDRVGRQAEILDAVRGYCRKHRNEKKKRKTGGGKKKRNPPSLRVCQLHSTLPLAYAFLELQDLT